MSKSMHSILLVTAIILVSILSGCATYTCPSPKAGIKCTPVSEIYNRVVEKGERIEEVRGSATEKETDTTISQRVSEILEKIEQNKEITEKKAEEKGGLEKKDLEKRNLEKKDIEKKDTGKQEDMQDSIKMLLRKPSKIVKIWIAPWEDDDGDLNQGGYIYSEITPPGKKWIVGEKPMEKKDKTQMKFFQKGLLSFPKTGPQETKEIPRPYYRDEYTDKEQNIKTSPKVYSITPGKSGEETIESSGKEIPKEVPPKVTIDKSTLENALGKPPLAPRVLPKVDKPKTEAPELKPEAKLETKSEPDNEGCENDFCQVGDKH